MRTSALLLAILALIVVEPCSAQPPPPPPGGGSTGGGFNGPGGGGTSGGGTGSGGASGGGWVSSASVVGGSAVQNSQPGTKGGENCDGSDQVPSSPVTRSNNLPGIPREETQICIHVHDNEPQPPGTDCGGCCGDGGAAAPGGGVSPAVLRDTGGGGGGCASCGGGGPSSNATSGNFTTYSSGRGFYPEGRGVYTSFGPGQTSDYDSKIFLYPDGAGGTDASFYNAVSGRVYSLVDGLDGDTSDGEFHDLVTKSVESFTISDGSGNPVSDVTLATTGVINYHSGVKQDFDILALTDGSGNPEYVARLAGSTDRNGRTLTIAYRDSLPAGSGGFTAQELTDAPDRHLQIHQVTDWKGDVATYHYKSTQESGRWVVEKIDLPDGDDIDYAYTDGNLTSITIQDGTVTSFAYGQDTESQAATVEITTSGANNGITIHLTNDYMTLDQSGQAAVINQPQGIFRLVNNAAGETQYMLVPDTNVANQYTVYKGSGQASEVVFGQLERHWEDGWQAVENSSQGGGSPVLGAPMTATVTMTGTQELAYAGAGSSTTVDDLYAGTIPELTDATGREYAYQYDADGFLTKKTFVADGTYEEYAYNTFKQVTRVRDRQGNVTLTEYDANGNRTKLKVGLKEVGGQDVAQPEYAEQSWAYYPVGHYAAGLLKTAYSPEWDGSSTDTHRTDYEYDARGNITKVLSSASVAGGTRPETNYTYNPDDSIASTTDSEGHTVTPLVDGKGRTIRTTYDDGSTEETLYGADGSGDEYKILKTKNRRNVVTSYSYDISGRKTQVTVGTAWDADILDGQADDTPIADRNEQSIRTYTYLDGTEDPITVVRDGSRTDYVYDYRGRVIETKVYPYANKILSSKVVYVDNNKFSDEDPYGRKKYYGYRASDGQLIRYVTGAYPSFSLADQDAVFNLVRDTNLNPDYTIKDAIADENGRPSVVIDERGTQSLTEYNAAGQVIRETKAVGTAVEAITEMDYDDAGDVVEIRSPRYFDPNDTNGFQKCKTVMTYDGAGRVLTRTEAPGTPEAGTESYTYDTHGRQVTRTDARGKIWKTTYANCCGHSIANENPLNEGSITNMNHGGMIVHSAVVSEIASVTSMLNPDNADTVTEATTQFDALGRSIASCIWLNPLDTVNVTAPQLAGFDGISADDGLTSQTVFDVDLADGIGLDSAAGISITNPLGGAFSVSLLPALVKLAEPESQGGGGVSFDSIAAGQATVNITPENEVSFEIMDATGRIVMSGFQEPHDAVSPALPGDLMDWYLDVYTQDFADNKFLLRHTKINSTGAKKTRWRNGLGHTVLTEDASSVVHSHGFNACGNRVLTADNRQISYDELGRVRSDTDALNRTLSEKLDRSGNLIARTLATGEQEFYTWDSRGRLIEHTDLRGNDSSWSYDKNGNLLIQTDEQSQQTEYVYNDVGEILEIKYPGHIHGTLPTQAGFDKITHSYDADGRLAQSYYQDGSSIRFDCGMDGRLQSRTYVSQSGVELSTDLFEFDRSGRLTSAFKGENNTTVSFDYDDASEMTKETLSIDGHTFSINYQHNTFGEVTLIELPDSSKFSREYTANGQLATVGYISSVGVASTLASLAYDTFGREEIRSFGNGFSTTRNWNSASELQAISTAGLLDLSYTFDSEHLPTSEWRTGVLASESWSCETLTNGRLKAWTQNGQSTSWLLSACGNWTTVNVDGVMENRVHDVDHRILEKDGVFLAYDARGNVTRDETGGTHSWNAHGLLKESNYEDGNSIGTTKYWYDALDRRVLKEVNGEVTYLINAGDQLLATTTDGSVFRKFAYGAFVDDSLAFVDGDEIFFTHTNRQFDVYAVSDVNGHVVQQNSYGPFGEFKAFDSDGNPVTPDDCLLTEVSFRGRMYDSGSNLYYFRAREYSPVLGRFMSRDPVGYSDGTNLYDAYFAPHHLDPTGEATCTATGITYVPTGSIPSRGGCVTTEKHCNIECICDDGSDPELGRHRTINTNQKVDIDVGDLPGALNPIDVVDLEPGELGNCGDIAKDIKGWVEWGECPDDDDGGEGEGEGEGGGGGGHAEEPIRYPYHIARPIMSRDPRSGKPTGQGASQRPRRVPGRPVTQPNRPLRRLPLRRPIRPNPIQAPSGGQAIPWPWEELWYNFDGKQFDPGAVF